MTWPLWTMRQRIVHIAASLEWPTLFILLICYAGWLFTSWLVSTGGYGYVALPVLIFFTTLHSSLQHEILHGHPSRNRLLNESLIYPALGLLFPFQRFRRLHLQHHNNARLTDPLDDPESFYLTQRQWRQLPRPARAFLIANNTFAGRLLLGPLLSVVGLIIRDIPAIRQGEDSILRAWLLHIPASLIVVGWLLLIDLPVYLYLLTVAYPAMSLLMVRTFAEHRAHQDPAARSIIIRSGPVMSLLFLNNNLHAVHHEHPTAAWYRLPGLFRNDSAGFLERNQGYTYSGYFALIRQYLLTPKEPVSHPLDAVNRETAG